MPIQIETIALDEAKQIIEKAIWLARTGHLAPVAVAVVGMDGQLVAFQAMDYVVPESGALARDKAYAAVMTQEAASDGGINIYKDNKTLGGIGISGSADENNQEIARKVCNWFRDTDFI
jgi:uncharacterized protein GlcG (DUF336 family)